MLKHITSACVRAAIRLPVTPPWCSVPSGNTAQAKRLRPRALTTARVLPNAALTATALPRHLSGRKRWPPPCSTSRGIPLGRRANHRQSMLPGASFPQLHRRSDHGQTIMRGAGTDPDMYSDLGIWVGRNWVRTSDPSLVRQARLSRADFVEIVAKLRRGHHRLEVVGFHSASSASQRAQSG